jgi:hypothetical protein
MSFAKGSHVNPYQPYPARRRIMFTHPLFKTVLSTVVAVALLGAGTVLYAQTTEASQRAYERKSVSSIDMVWLASPSARSLKPKQADLLLSAIKGQIMGEEGLGARFDYNSLEKESALVQRFIRKAGEEDSLTVERAAELLTETLAGPIVQILDAQKEARAKELVSEAERQKFIAVKAKELGITAGDFEKIMNSGYLYLPVLTKHSRKVTKTDEKKSVAYKLKGGIIWFKLKVSPEGKCVIEPVATLETKGSRSADLGSTHKLEGQKVDADTYAFAAASDWLAKNLAVKTAELEEFRLKAEVFEFAGGMVGFNLGKKEGLFVDQKFRVYEEYEDEVGNLKWEKKGFFMARKIGDNRTNLKVLSYGKRIIGAYEPGMMVKEFPRLGFDIAIRPGVASITIPDGDFWGYNLTIDKEIETLVPVIDLAAQTNMARFSGIPQLFATVGGCVGAIWPGDDVTITYSGADKKAIGLYWSVYGGIMKKHYVRQFAFFVEPRYEYQTFNFWTQFGEEEDEEKFTYTNSLKLISVAAGMEIALRADLNIGLTGGFKGIGAATQDEWTLKKKEADTEEDFIGPEVDYSGPFFGIQVIYSPATW